MRPYLAILLLAAILIAGCQAQEEMSEGTETDSLLVAPTDTAVAETQPPLTPLAKAKEVAQAINDLVMQADRGEIKAAERDRRVATLQGELESLRSGLTTDEINELDVFISELPEPRPENIEE